MIDPVEAETVRLIFKLIRHGDGTTGPMGVKATAAWLNEHGYRTRKGARFGIGPLHKLITNTIYKGAYRFNRRSANASADNPEEEQIIVPVPAIIDERTFDAVQAQLRARNPKKTPPRTVTGPILLTGLAKCAHCGGGMTLRTGKSGRYRYYACASKAQKGKSACKGRAVPMAMLDDQVTEHLAARLLTPERTEKLLVALIKRQDERKADHESRMSALKTKLDEAESKLRNLYEAIEKGIADLSDPTLKERVAAAKTERDIADTAIERALTEQRPEAKITPEKVATFTKVMRENITQGETPFRKAWLRALIDSVEVDEEEVRVHGRRSVLERMVMGGGGAPAGVPSFVREWRTR